MSARRRRKLRRGFASMSAARVREIARLGGVAVSRDHEHMRAIGALGGTHRRGWRKGTRRSLPPLTSL